VAVEVGAIAVNVADTPVATASGVFVAVGGIGVAVTTTVTITGVFVGVAVGVKVGVLVGVIVTVGDGVHVEQLQSVAVGSMVGGGSVVAVTIHGV